MLTVMTANRKVVSEFGQEPTRKSVLCKKKKKTLYAKISQLCFHQVVVT